MEVLVVAFDLTTEAPRQGRPRVRRVAGDAVVRSATSRFVVERPERGILPRMVTSDAVKHAEKLR
jgi:hypothetical protein